MTDRAVHPLRLRTLNEAPERPDADFVLYWMVAARRLTGSFALDHAVDRARALKLPLVILEALSADYPWACARFHRFVADGMAEKAAALRDGPVLYYPYLEPRPGAGKGLMDGLAARAALVVTDDYPCFGLDHMVERFAERSPVRVHAVDGNGLLPMAAADKAFKTAYSFRRFLQKTLREYLEDFPAEDPLTERPPPGPPPDLSALQSRFPPASAELLGSDGLPGLEVPAEPGIVERPGGSAAAVALLEDFLEHKLPRYTDKRNRVDEDVTSGLSPYLHWGHLGAHETVRALLESSDWNPGRLSDETKGARRGWWGLGEDEEGFLDQIVTWRELGFNACRFLPDYDRFESLPDWVQKNYEAHASDPREYLYTLEEFEQARTHDEVWNAAQMQLVREGVMHNYMRMLWGKKVLEWTRSPREALRILIELNNKYALDGRDPNSYSGIFWVLGRYDRPWAPVRPVFGQIRFMSSASTLRKTGGKPYIARYAPRAQQSLLPES